METTYLNYCRKHWFKRDQCFIQQCNGHLPPQVTYSTGNSPYSLNTADVNGDSQVEYYCCTTPVQNMSVFYSTMVTAHLLLKSLIHLANQPQSVTATDIDGDNKVAIIVANAGSNNVGVFLLQW
jgi:hypothetical protein